MLGVIGSTVIAGCAGLRSRRADVALDTVVLRNLSESGHEVNVSIMREGTRISRRRVRVGAEGTDSRSVVVVSQTFPGTATHYSIEASLQDSSQNIRAELQPVEGSTCIDVEIRITQQSRLEVWSSDANNC